MTAAEYRAMMAKKPSKPPNSPATPRKQPDPHTEPKQSPALIVVPVWKPLGVYTCPSAEPDYDRVVVPRCPSAHTEALKAHIEAFKP